jgi:hypothetical protein
MLSQRMREWRRRGDVEDDLLFSQCRCKAKRLSVKGLCIARTCGGKGAVSETDPGLAARACGGVAFATPNVEKYGEGDKEEKNEDAGYCDAYNSAAREGGGRGPTRNL